MDREIGADRMSLITTYLNQTATWKQRTGTDGFGDPQWVESEIAVRWQPQLTRVRNQDGEEVTASARVYTTAAVGLGDVLVGPDGREWPVITVQQPTLFSGAESHREVMV